jgi:hypothetical protein
MKIPVPVIRLLNPLVAALLRSPLHSLMSRDTMLLTFTGRKTGKSYTTPISYMRDGDLVRCFTHSPWSKNLRGGAPVTVRIEGRDQPGRGEAIAGDIDRISEAITEFLTRVPRDLPYYDVTLDADGRPNASQVRAAAVETVMIEIRLDPPRA